MEGHDPNADGDEYTVQSNALSAWFLGPRAENSQLFNKLVLKTFRLHEDKRRNYFPTDPAYVTTFQKLSKAYRSEKKQLKTKLTEMNDELSQSTPIFSPRFQGHMNWDITMPSFLGYISGMLWNPNNVDVTASPVTTPYEILASNQICDMIGFDRNVIEPWGHITCGGSIANIEALWSARNLKFYPQSLQDAVKGEDALAGAKDYEVQVADSTTKVKLSECSTWQLLNVDVDEACKMADGVATAAGVTIDTLSTLVHPYSYTSTGIASFLIKHSIESPRFFCPATCHYSWPKAATVLGIGEDNLILIKVDDHARQDMNDLRAQLQHCVKYSIPVISVTAVMGSTEESAMDPLTEVLAMRNEFRKQGLNYCILVDAAWGAYMRTMLIDPDPNTSAEERQRRLPITSFVPISPLSQYVIDNLNAVRHADTVTSDPHKTGYCPYPAGGLSYRNGTMKDFVLLAAPEVFHSKDDLSVGVNGLEGSKPGAAAAGVLLSHRVIGLDKYGYGRILGQCVYGSKIFYCMWQHLAKPTDPFVIKTYTPCDPNDSELMKTLIYGKGNLAIASNKDAMALLARVGADALIIKFGINLKIDGVVNDDVDVSTNYSKKIGQLLSVNADKDVHRVPMIIFQSVMHRDTFGDALEAFENSLGLTKNNENPFACMVNTVMNPWQTNAFYVAAIGEIYRQGCFVAHGWATDKAFIHHFVNCGEVLFSESDGWYFFATLCANFNLPSEQYNTVIKFAAVNEEDGLRLKNILGLGSTYFANQEKYVLYDLLEEARADGGVAFNVYPILMKKKSAATSFMLKVVDVVTITHFLPANEAGLDYPDNQQYHMFGDGGKVYLSHIITKKADFQQVVEVSSIHMTNDDDKMLIWYGVKVTFPDLAVDKANPTVNPFNNAERVYKIEFSGRKQEKREMDITLKNNTGWFDNTFLNAQKPTLRK